jgi:hypothetical protein
MTMLALRRSWLDPKTITVTAWKGALDRYGSLVERARFGSRPVPR